MNSEWWDIFFNDLYNRVKIALMILVCLSTMSRINISCTGSFSFTFCKADIEIYSLCILLI